MPHPTGHAHHRRGILLMAIAMLSAPIVDGLAKYLSTDYSPLFLGWARYAIASAIVLPIGIRVHGRGVLPSERVHSHVFRTAFLVAAMTLYFLSIARTPLAAAAGAFFISPILAVVLSVLVLGERMTSVKGIALAFGVAGSLVMLRPGGSTDPGLLLAFGAGVLFAAYLITTRQASQVTDPVKTLVFQCVFGTLLLTPQAIATWRVPSSDAVIFFVALGALSAASHLMSISAFRFAEASTLAPLVYLELVGASLFGYFVFAEVPSVTTLTGAALIVLGGIILARQDHAGRAPRAVRVKTRP